MIIARLSTWVSVCRASSPGKTSRSPSSTQKSKEFPVLKPPGPVSSASNADAYESYGREKGQGLNAPVGKYAAFAYTTALNHLLSDQKHRLSVGDTTVVFWAESPKPVYQNIFTAVLSPQNEDENKLLSDVMERIAQGKPVADDVDLQTPFYILGLAPNAARLSVRFFLRDSFGGFLNHIRRHYDDLEIAHAPQDFPYLTPYWLLRETVNPNSNSKASSPLMSGEVLRSILLGLPYPQALQKRSPAPHPSRAGRRGPAYPEDHPAAGRLS
jgi:CRISPR-associated protein Csd1